MDREEDRFFVNIDRWPQDEATPFTLLSSFVYNPSTGLRKDTGSRYLPTREVYTSNPNESSGNALVRGFIHGPLPMLRRRMGVWKKALGASLRNILLKILLALSSISTMTLLLLYLFLFRARNKAEQRRQPRHWQWQHYRQTYLTDDSQTLYDDDADFPPLCKRAQRSSARRHSYEGGQAFIEFQLALANAIKSGELTFIQEAIQFADLAERELARDLLLKTLLIDCAQQWEARIAVLEVLQHFMDEQTCHILLGTLQDDEDSLVRTATVRTLGAVKMYVPIEELSELLRDKNEAWNVREMAALMLGENAELVYPELLVRAVHDEDEDVRRAVIWALCQLGERAPLPALVEALRDEDEFIRETAAQALWHAGKRGQEALLMAAFSDKNGMVSNVAEGAVGETGANALAKLLIAGFKEGKPSQSSPTFLSFLRQRLTTDLEVGNEPKDSPLWLLCTPDSTARKTEELPRDTHMPPRPTENTKHFNSEYFDLDEQSFHLPQEKGASAIWQDPPKGYCIDNHRAKPERTTEDL